MQASCSRLRRRPRSAGARPRHRGGTRRRRSAHGYDRATIGRGRWAMGKAGWSRSPTKRRWSLTTGPRATPWRCRKRGPSWRASSTTVYARSSRLHDRVHDRVQPAVPHPADVEVQHAREREWEQEQAGAAEEGSPRRAEAPLVPEISPTSRLEALIDEVSDRGLRLESQTGGDPGSGPPTGRPLELVAAPPDFGRNPFAVGGDNPFAAGFEAERSSPSQHRCSSLTAAARAIRAASAVNLCGAQLVRSGWDRVR